MENSNMGCPEQCRKCSHAQKRKGEYFCKVIFQQECRSGFPQKIQTLSMVPGRCAIINADGDCEKFKKKLLG